MGAWDFEYTTPDGKSFDVEADTEEQYKEAIAHLEGQTAKPQSYGAGLARQAAQGLTFGFADEIESGIRGTPVQQIRAQNKQFQQENPAAALGAEFAGSIPTAFIPILGQAKKVQQGKQIASLGRQMWTGSKLGAAYGAATGAGTAEGGIANRAENAALFGVGGAVTGGALPAAVQGVGYLGRAAGRKVGLGIPNTIQDKSDDLVLSGFERDRTTPADVWAKLQAEGSPSTIADVAGEQTRGRMAGAMSLPGQAQGDAAQFMESRAAGAADRLAGNLKATAGMPDQDVFAYSQRIMDEARSLAKPLYEKAYASEAAEKAVQFKSEKIQPLLKNPYVQKAFQKGQELYEVERSIAASNGQPLPPLRELYRQEGSSWVPAGAQADVRTLDYLQRGLQEEIDTAYKAGQGGLAEQLVKVKKQVLGFLEDASPEIRSARTIWRGGKEGEEALELGRKFLVKDHRQIAAEMADLSPSAREVYRTGAIDALRVQLRSAKDKSDVTAKLMSKEMRDRLRPLFPDEQNYQKFLNAVSVENKRAGTRRRLAGSRTQPLANELADIEGVSGPAIGILESFMLGRWKSGIGQTAAAFVRKATGLTQPVSEDITSRLLNPDMAANQQYLERLAGIQQMRLNQAAGQSGRRAGYSALMGSLPGLLQ